MTHTGFFSVWNANCFCTILNGDEFKIINLVIKQDNILFQSDGLSSSENIVRDKTDFGTINANIDIPAITQLSAEGSHITLETINEIEMAVLGMKLVQEYHRKCSIMITTDGTNKRLFNELITQLTQAHQPYILLNSDHNTLDVASVQYGIYFIKY